MARAVAAVLLVACAGLAACQREGEPTASGGGMIETPPGGFDYELDLGREGPMRGRVGGVQVEIERALVLEDPSIAKAAITGYTLKGIGQPQLKVRGKALRIEREGVRIGERDYGQVAGDGTVSITAAGVTIGGDLRGPLP